MTTETYWHGSAYVCTDCYFAHHYGWTPVAVDPMADDGPLTGPIGWDEVPAYLHDGWTVRYFAGESDIPCDAEPLSRLAGCELADNTEPHDADDYSGIVDFTWSSCDGCRSTLGGSRYRLAYRKS